MTDTEDKKVYKEVIHDDSGLITETTNCGIALETSATPQFISALADMVFAQAESLAIDLESFAGHAKRSIINVEDVKLCCRRNEGLWDVIQEFLEGLERRKRLEKESREQAASGRGAGGNGRGRGRGRGKA